MSARAAFKQQDVARAVKGCQAAGLEVGTVRVLPDGSIEVYAASAAGDHAPQPNSVDRLLHDKTS